MVRCLETEYERQWYDDAPVDTVKIVITEKLVTDSLNLQLPTGEEGKYARMVTLDIKAIKQLKLEYKSISIIDNLSNFTALTKLQLCNNVIKKIEKLDALVNLTWLDLSFNSIRKIENLDQLKKLEVLDLHRNFITTLENMDNLLRLMVNEVEDIKYLRQFVRLRSASFDGNPMAKNPAYFTYLIAFVPQLQMVDYKFVRMHEREVANVKYKAQVDKLLVSDDSIIRRASVIEADEEVESVNKDALVDVFEGDSFWNSLYLDDPEGKALLKIKELGDTEQVYQELFRNLTKNLFDKGMRHYQLRENEKKAYNTAVGEELHTMQKAGNSLTDGFYEYAGVTLKDIEILVTFIEDSEKQLHLGLILELPQEFTEYQSQLNSLAKEYVYKLHTTWESLITNEVEFNEQLQEVNDLLDRSLQEITTNWMEQILGQFNTLRDAEQQLYDRIDHAITLNGDLHLSNTTTSEEEDEENEWEEEKEQDEEEESEENYEMEEDDSKANKTSTERRQKERKNQETPPVDTDEEERQHQALSISHEKHLAYIGKVQEDFTKKLIEWQKSFSEELEVKEYQRNKARMEEISHFTDTYSEYLDRTRAFHHITIFIPSVRQHQECTDSKECKPLEWYQTLTTQLREKYKKFKTIQQPEEESSATLALTKKVKDKKKGTKMGEKLDENRLSFIL